MDQQIFMLGSVSGRGVKFVMSKLDNPEELSQKDSHCSVESALWGVHLWTYLHLWTGEIVQWLQFPDSSMSDFWTQSK